MSQLPMRKRVKPVSNDEKNWILRHGFNIDEYMSEEIDIPAGDKLEVEMENEFRNKEYPNDFVLKEESPIKLIKKYYKYLDKLLSIYGKYVPCKKGCSKCCNITVHVFDLEINIIKHFLDKNKIKYSYNSIINGHSNRKDYSGVICPFLENNICSIYEVRPFMCRKYFVFNDNNNNCGAQSDKKVKQFIAGYIIEIIYEKIIETYYKKKGMNINFIQEDIIFKDIREHFNKL
jgi:uncharacterized protein